MPGGCALVVSCAVTSGCKKVTETRPPSPNSPSSLVSGLVPAHPAPGQDRRDAEERAGGQALQHDAGASQRGSANRGGAPRRRGGPGPGGPRPRRRRLRSWRRRRSRGRLAPPAPHDGGAEIQPEEEHDRLEDVEAVTASSPELSVGSRSARLPRAAYSATSQATTAPKTHTQARQGWPGVELVPSFEQAGRRRGQRTTDHDQDDGDDGRAPVATRLADRVKDRMVPADSWRRPP